MQDHRAVVLRGYATRTNQAGQTGTLTYNADGQVTNGREWDVLGRLTKLGGTTFGYDALDLRRTITTTAGTKKWSWDVNNPLPLLNVEYRADGSYWRHRYLPDDGGKSLSGVPMYAEHPSVTGHTQPYGMSMMLHDALGTVTDSTDTAGTSRWRHDYEPFGTRTTTKLTPDAVDPAVGFTGASLEPNTGEYHLRARDYNLWGVFSTPDPITPDIADPYVSGYIYANQQPTLLIDPSGLTAGWPGPGDAWDVIQKGLNNGVVSAVGIAGAIAEWSDVSGSGLVVRELTGKVPSEYLNNATVKYLGITGNEPVARISKVLTNLLSGGGISVTCIKVTTKAGAALLKSLLLKSSKNAATKGGRAPVLVGQAGETAVRSAYGIGPKATRTVNGRARIFDGLTDTTVSEVKNVKYQGLTRQIQDYIDYSKANGLRFDLYVRRTTDLSGPLQDAIAARLINLRYIP